MTITQPTDALGAGSLAELRLRRTQLVADMNEAKAAARLLWVIGLFFLWPLWIIAVINDRKASRLRDEIALIDLRLRESFGELPPPCDRRPTIAPTDRPRRPNSWWTGKWAAWITVLVVLAVLAVIVVTNMP